jgi:hypothetical protein
MSHSRMIYEDNVGVDSLSVGVMALPTRTPIPGLVISGPAIDHAVNTSAGSPVGHQIVNWRVSGHIFARLQFVIDALSSVIGGRREYPGKALLECMPGGVNQDSVDPIRMDGDIYPIRNADGSRNRVSASSRCAVTTRLADTVTLTLQR